MSPDDATLERLGKKPILRRDFGFVAILGFSCTVLITWEATLFNSGGPSGIIYGYLLVWAGMLSTFTTLGELCSMAPTSGGQYHYVAMLSPPRAQKLLSYLTGWLTLTGWQALIASSELLAVSMIQSIALLTHPEYRENMRDWQATLMLWAAVALSYGINTSFNKLFIRFEGVAFIIHILGFFGVVIPLVLLSDHVSTEQVFGTFSNLGGWPTQGLSFCIGIMGTVLSFLGGDGAIHLAEEIENAAVVLPRSLIGTLLLNGAFGFAMLIATLYCMGDVNAAFEEDPNFPFVAILRRATGSTTGAALMVSVVIIMTFTAATGCLTTTSRILFALARDRAVPGWRVLKKTSPRTTIPRYAALVAAVIAALLSLINAGNSIAFDGVISISVAGILGSYLIAASLLLWRRLTGGIGQPRDDDSKINTIGKDLRWGPWHIHGALGVINNVFTCAYLFFIFFFSFWPVQTPVTPQNMNWGVLVTGAALIFSVIYYYIWARKVYKGPIIEV
ncbi:amino acid transporter-like protein [Hypoxylon sp. NC0597]|nr:amino acid transporter-like protein [Hypoxylon sp. NC0597]